MAEAFAAANAIALEPTMPPRYRAGRHDTPTLEVWVAEPLAYMNRSGEAVRSLLEHAAAEPASLIVVHDDLDLPLGRLRFKRRGGPGGHNGVRSIIDVLGTDAFTRLKVGVSRPPAGQDPVAYVLEPFRAGEREAVEAVIARACDALDVAVNEGVSVAMNRFHPS